MCEYIHADVSMNLGGSTNVKCKSKSTELCAKQANIVGPPIVNL